MGTISFHGDLLRKVSKSNIFDSDDSFWDDYNKLSPAYQKQLDPYLNFTYSKGWWDRLGNTFGFKTGEDKYRDQMAQQARLAAAGFLNDQFQNQYNSQASQAARMRDAGVNPDLNGEISGDAAAQQEQPFPLLDQSQFDPPMDVFTDIASFFGSAAAGLQSVGTFRKLLADVFKTKEETAGIQIKNAQDAYNYAGDYLSAFDPSTRRDFDMTPERFVNEIIPSKVSAIDKQFSYLDPKAREYLKRAVTARKNDPALYDVYYKNYTSAVNSRSQKLTDTNLFGALDKADEVVQQQNSVAYNYLLSIAKLRLQANKILAQYNLQKYQNDFDYESFKTRWNLPLELAETDLYKYISEKAYYKYQAAKDIASKEWLSYLDRLRKSKDPASIYLFNALIQGGYSPLLNTSLSGGVFGLNGSGSWNNFIVPQMNRPADALLKGASPAYSIDPYGWSQWDNK